MLKFRQWFLHFFLRFRKYHLKGKDEFGNRYYEKKPLKESEEGKRSVIYRGSPEPAKISPEWYGWLHYMSQEPLQKISFVGQKKRDSKPMLPDSSRRPLKSSICENKGLPYTRWTPEENLKKQLKVDN